jgi:hypothetical protein
MNMFIQPDPALDVHIASFGHGRNHRITIIKTRALTGADEWVKLETARVVLAGHVARPLKQLLTSSSRRKINAATATEEQPSGAFSSSTFKRLRDHLGLNTPAV